MPTEPEHELEVLYRRDLPARGAHMREENGQAAEHERLSTERDNILRQISPLLDDLLSAPDDFERLQGIYRLMATYLKLQKELYPSFTEHFIDRARHYGQDSPIRFYNGSA